jgi:hypothetical protein
MAFLLQEREGPIELFSRQNTRHPVSNPPPPFFSSTDNLPKLKTSNLWSILIKLFHQSRDELRGLLRKRWDGVGVCSGAHDRAEKRARHIDHSGAEPLWLVTADRPVMKE